MVFVGGLLVLLVSVAAISFQDQRVATSLRAAYMLPFIAVVLTEGLVSPEEETVLLVP